MLYLFRSPTAHLAPIVEAFPQVRKNEVLPLSGSTFEVDAEESRQARVNAYITKLLGLAEYTRVVQTTLKTWHALVSEAHQ
ncbi:hypothetical protein ACFSC4_27685 [Deinococcus malanensis]|uniref:hypothetical protein n=1 Tax=Deinococcus malanensis TaxID=1706855 RepID=UPI0036290FA8